MNKYQKERQMSGSVETTKDSKDYKETTTTLYQGEQDRENNTGNIGGNQSRRWAELVHVHTAHIYFMDDTPKLGVVIGLLFIKLDIGTAFDNFREKLKG